VERIRRFLEDTRAELGKVTWPTPRQTVNLTVIVFVVAGVVGAYIFAWDFVLTRVTGFITTLGGS
jgi:preprotein translocase subunit SecE